LFRGSCRARPSKTLTSTLSRLSFSFSCTVIGLHVAKAMLGFLDFSLAFGGFVPVRSSSAWHWVAYEDYSWLLIDC
jgi:hypothetical protein